MEKNINPLNFIKIYNFDRINLYSNTIRINSDDDNTNKINYSNIYYILNDGYILEHYDNVIIIKSNNEKTHILEFKII